MRNMRNMRRGIGPGILFLLPALFFGGWVVLAVLGGLFGAALMVCGSLFRGMASAVSSIFAHGYFSGGLAVGIGIGIALYYTMKKKNAAKDTEESAGIVDGEEAETEIAEEPVRYFRMGE